MQDEEKEDHARFGVHGLILTALGRHGIRLWACQRATEKHGHVVRQDKNWWPVIDCIVFRCYLFRYPSPEPLQAGIVLP